MVQYIIYMIMCIAIQYACLVCGRHRTYICKDPPLGSGYIYLIYIDERPHKHADTLPGRLDELLNDE